MKALADRIVVIIGAKSGRQFLKSFGISFRPPILQSSFTVVFTAIGIKGMRDFMTDDDADAPEIGPA